MEPKNGVLEDDFSFSNRWFSGVQPLLFGGCKLSSYPQKVVFFWWIFEARRWDEALWILEALVRSFSTWGSFPLSRWVASSNFGGIPNPPDWHFSRWWFFPNIRMLVGYLFCNKFPGWKVYVMFDDFCRVCVCVLMGNYSGYPPRICSLTNWERRMCTQKTQVCLWSVRVACPVPLEFWLGSMVRSGLLTVIYDLYSWFIYAYVMSFHCRQAVGVYWHETANLQSFISGSMVDVNSPPLSLKFQLVAYHIIAIFVAKQVGANFLEFITPHETNILPSWELTCHVTRPLVKMIIFFPRCDMLVP